MLNQILFKQMKIIEKMLKKKQYITVHKFKEFKKTLNLPVPTT